METKDVCQERAPLSLTAPLLTQAFCSLAQLRPFIIQFCDYDTSCAFSIDVMAERFVCKGSTADEAWSPQADQAEDTLPTIDDPFASNIFSASSAQDSIISTSGFITVLRSLLAPRVEKGTSPNGTLSLMGPSDTSQDGQPFWTGSHSAACLEPIDVAPSSPMAGNPSQE